MISPGMMQMAAKGVAAIGSGIGRLIKNAKAKKAMKKAREAETKAYKHNMNDLIAEKSKDPLQSAGAQAMISQTYDLMTKQNQNIAGQAAMGMAPETMMAARAANATAISNATQGIAANNDERVDNLGKEMRQSETAHGTALANSYNQESQMYQNQAKEIAKAGQQAQKSINSLDFGSISKMLGK